MRLTDKDKIKELSTLEKNKVVMTDNERKELKLGQLEYVEELCERIRRECVYYKTYDDDIKIYAFGDDEILYSFEYHYIRVRERGYELTLDVRSYGIVWAFTVEELEVER